MEIEKTLISENDLPLQAHFYNETHIQNLDLRQVAKYLKEKELFSEIKIEDSFVKKYENQTENIARNLAKTRVKNLETPERDFEISNSDIKFEQNQISGEINGMTSLLYDGFRLGKAYSNLIPADKKGDSHLHIIFTNRFFATWKPATRRYHARVSVYGFPSIISTTGMVDAPARPKGFYWIVKTEHGSESPSISVENEMDKYGDEFVFYDDDRFNEIMKGYAMQAVFYHLFSGPFCNKKDCRLYNPHLQKNILKAQLTSPEFCDKHRKILEEMKEMVRD